MGFEKLLETPVGRILLSTLLGIGFASIFRTACTDKKCIQFQGPVLKDIDGKIFKHDEKCFIYKPTSTKCNTDAKQIVNFAQAIE